MKITRAKYPGWKGPIFRAHTYEDYLDIRDWMYKHDVGSFLLASGSSGYFFQIKKNAAFFILKWG